MLLLYHSSPIEREWTEAPGGAAGKICEIARKPSQLSNWSQMLALNGKQPDADVESLSFFQFGNNTKEFIEPLTGVARHPFAAVGCRLGDFGVTEAHVLNYSYIVLPRGRCKQPTQATQPQAARKNKLFDLGCSTFRSKRRKKESDSTGTFLGASIPLFIGMYEDICIWFDSIVGWEAKPLKNWFKHVPYPLMERIDFRNTPVTAAKFRAELTKCSADDYVVVKLDIDHSPTELEIVDVILELSHLVDEFYFEYHFWFDNLNFGWGRLKQLRKTHNATTAIDLMHRLRRTGVRAHFWI